MTTQLMEALPIAACTGNLYDILKAALGPNLGGYTAFSVGYHGADDLANVNNGTTPPLSYWDPNNPAVTTWYQDGNLVVPDTETTPVPATDLAALQAVEFQAGNDIWPSAWITAYDAAGNRVVFEIPTVDPTLINPNAGNGAPTAQDVVNAAEAFDAKYHGVPNNFDCHFIAADVAAAAGATFEISNTQSTTPSENQESGFWRIAYQGDVDPNPAGGWSTLVQAGDIVRMGDKDADGNVTGYHTTTIVKTYADGSLDVFDNADSDPGFNSIGIHHIDAPDYPDWNSKAPDTITIYRISDDHLYLSDAANMTRDPSDSAQNDHLVGTIFNDELIGGIGADTLDGGAGSDYASYRHAQTGVVASLEAPLTNTGEAAGDTYISIENLIGSSHDDQLTGDIHDNILQGLAGNDHLYGDWGKDTLYGGDGNDVLDGGGDLDTLAGGTGDDHYILNSTTTWGPNQVFDEIFENPGEGNDTAEVDPTSINTAFIDTYTLAFNVENGVIDGSKDFKLTGNDIANTLTGNSGANTLDGAGGDDVLWGGAGNDTLIGNYGNDELHGGDDNDNLSGGFGNDVLYGDKGNDILSGGLNDDKLFGGDGDDTLNGDAGNDLLAGDAGYDTLAGGADDDTYILKDVSMVGGQALYDKVVETGGNGTDTIEVGFASVMDEKHLVHKVSSYIIGGDTSVENGIIIGSDNFDLTGNGLDNQLTGNSAQNTLDGAGGNDTLKGGGGFDILKGGTGDDTYILDDVTMDPNSSPANPKLLYDAISEAAGPSNGYDTVFVGQESLVVNGGTFSTKVYDMSVYAQNVEHGVVSGTANFDLIGNDSDNSLTGNDAANTLSGGNGNDSLFGADGNDTLFGGVGDDVLSGGAGFDKLAGGDGNDLYYLSDVALQPGVPVNIFNPQFVFDTIQEDNSATSGIDTLYVGAATGTVNGQSYVVSSYTMADNVENGVVTGSDAFNLTGNASDNTLTGNDAVNTLSGGAGKDTLDGHGGLDTLLGGDGDDIYHLNDVSVDLTDPLHPKAVYDTVVEAAGSGTDTVMVGQATVNYPGQSLTATSYTLGDNVENGTVTGSAAFSLTGNALANTLIGNSASNVLSGGDGNDTLYGGGGSDTYDPGRGNDTINMWHQAFQPAQLDTIDFRDARFGQDVVNNFEAGTDVLAFSKTVFSDFHDMMNHAAQVGADTVITLDSHDTITLAKVDMTHLTASDFHLL